MATRDILSVSTVCTVKSREVQRCKTKNLGVMLSFSSLSGFLSWFSLRLHRPRLHILSLILHEVSKYRFNGFKLLRLLSQSKTGRPIYITSLMSRDIESYMYDCQCWLMRCFPPFRLSVMNTSIRVITVQSLLKAWPGWGVMMRRSLLDSIDGSMSTKTSKNSYRYNHKHIVCPK